MSDYHENPSFDAQADAIAGVLTGLEESGEPYCANCLRLEKYCDCDNPKIMVYDEEIDGYRDRQIGSGLPLRVSKLNNRGIK